jgi:hypothetical protein
MLTALAASFSNPADRVEAILEWLDPIASCEMDQSEISEKLVKHNNER